MGELRNDRGFQMPTTTDIGRMAFGVYREEREEDEKEVKRIPRS